MSDTSHEHVVPYGVYVKVWAALIALTGLTVAVSYADMAGVPILTAILIAAVKVSLVMLYFMHLRYERPLYFYMILVVLVTYLVFLALTFSDYAYR